VYDFQTIFLRAALHWSQITALVVLALGLLCTLQGFRFARALCALTCAVAGFLGGAAVAQRLDSPPLLPALSVGVTLGVLTVLRFRLGLLLSSTVVFASLGQYLAVRIGLRPDHYWAGLLLGAAVGMSLFYLHRRTVPILVTSLEGAALLILGFLGLARAIAPSLAQTFVAWAADVSAMVPVLITMLVVLGYSVQANLQQGDMQTGAGRGWNSVEAA